MKIKCVEIKNYRSIDNLRIEFEGYYTAICGKNNSGKSNIIRAILILLEKLRYNDRINYNTDYPVWKFTKSSKDNITIDLTMDLFATTDSGLIRFINYFGADKSKKDETAIKDIELRIKLIESSNRKDSYYEIYIDGQGISDAYRAKEILRRIQTSQLVVFHNSTQVERRYRGSAHGYVEKLSNTSKENIELKFRSIHRQISKVVDKHKNELQKLLGILEDKYQIELSFSSLDFNIDRIPYEISLGEKNYELPLEVWGSGTKNRTLILTNIFNTQNQIDSDEETTKITPVIFIEEPEAFLHPLAQAEFGRVLQDLAKELKIQIITTTHSPYLLSHYDPQSNLLVKRKIVRNKLRETFIESVNQSNWKEPFELALGMVGPEFDSLKKAFFSTESNLLLVEGDIDKEYFELLRKNELGDKKLKYEGDIFPYDGFGFLTNTVLLNFIKNRFKNVIITLDLDTSKNVISNLDKTGFVKDKNYFLIGIDKPGKRNIEGLLPQIIIDDVNKKNTELVQALFSDDKDEVKSAKSRLKQLYLNEFKKKAEYTEEYFGEFVKVTKKINNSLKAT